MTPVTFTRVAVVGGARTPFAKAGTAFRKHSPLHLSVHSVNGLLAKQQLDPHSVEEFAYGITVVDARIPHFARDVVFATALVFRYLACPLLNSYTANLLLVCLIRTKT